MLPLLFIVPHTLATLLCDRTSQAPSVSGSLYWPLLLLMLSQIVVYPAIPHPPPFFSGVATGYEVCINYLKSYAAALKYLFSSHVILSLSYENVNFREHSFVFFLFTAVSQALQF